MSIWRKRQETSENQSLDSVSLIELVDAIHWFWVPSAPMVPGTFMIPIGLLITGWTVEHKTHWIGPDIVSSSALHLGNYASDMYMLLGTGTFRWWSGCSIPRRSNIHSWLLRFARRFWWVSETFYSIVVRDVFPQHLQPWISCVRSWASRSHYLLPTCINRWDTARQTRFWLPWRSPSDVQRMSPCVPAILLGTPNLTHTYIGHGYSGNMGKASDEGVNSRSNLRSVINYGL